MFVVIVFFGIIVVAIFVIIVIIFTIVIVTMMATILIIVNIVILLVIIIIPGSLFAWVNNLKVKPSFPGIYQEAQPKPAPKPLLPAGNCDQKVVKWFIGL